MAHGDPQDTEANRPPDRGAAGDVSTTGHAGREVDHIDTVKSTGTTAGHAAHATDDHTHGAATRGHDHNDDLDDEDDNGGHGGHGHGDDASEQSTLVPTTWRQLILPALIVLLVGILVWGPVTGAFQSRPASSSTPTEQHNSTTNEPGTTGEPTHAPEPDATEETSPEPTATAPASHPPTANPVAIATQTAVGIEAQASTVARAPVQLFFAGREFVVKGGSNLLPDWTPPQDHGIATWIEGTYANHILYLPYSEENEALFKSAKQADTIKLVMNTGQVFEFQVTRSERAFNGPSTDRTRFTVTSAMSQDHAGVTLFLIGDPAPDRAVVQADFNGNIQ